MADKILLCGTCGGEFVFSVREQEFYAGMGYVDPRHCGPCRRVRKQYFADTVPVTCEECGGVFRVSLKEG